MEKIEKQILLGIQDGLPIEKRPFAKIAGDLGIEQQELIDRVKKMLEKGWIRRIGAIPHHYNLGITANGMSVWDVPDRKADEVGQTFGSFDFVTHCYLRPRHRPIWPYNLFAMVHGRTREEVYDKVEQLQEAADLSSVEKEVLFSTRLLKKQGFRMTNDSSNT